MSESIVTKQTIINLKTIFLRNEIVSIAILSFGPLVRSNFWSRFENGTGQTLITAITLKSNYYSRPGIDFMSNSQADQQQIIELPSEVNGIVKEFEKAFFDIPFDNSAFQNVHFVVQQQLTPGRAYRAIGLRMSAKIRALQEAFFNLQAEEIDLAELQEKRDNPETNKFDALRANLEIQRKLANRSYTDKLVNDAIVELKTLYTEFKKLPQYDREKFEAEEHTHFDIRLKNQMHGIAGASEALLAMSKPVSNPSLFSAESAKKLTQGDSSEKT